MKKLLIGFVIGGIVFGCVGIYAANYLASDISYTPSDETWDVANVNDAINDLYNKSMNSLPDTYTLYNNSITYHVDSRPITQIVTVVENPGYKYVYFPYAVTCDELGGNLSIGYYDISELETFTFTQYTNDTSGISPGYAKCILSMTKQ